ncbi:MAG TPA: alpha/beta fold hydrolase [Marmoricola sp.]|jgi:pimeloyl-ACP methyl ester carboxylesterase|nr:alpha/beta fold hydrolase [Marmoricola sp.]
MTTPAQVPESAELFAPVSADVELCYQTFGDPSGDPLLLVMGLGGPMNWWDAELCRMLAAAGFYVIRYDNRDTGRSSRARGRVTRGMLVRAFTTGRGPAPYGIGDLADDGFGLLDHLGIDRVHLAGVSMGGMIVQTMAVARPERVLSLVSIMSTTGRRTVGWQHPALLPVLIAPRRPGLEAYVEGTVRMSKLIGSPGYPADDDESRRRGAETFQRGVDSAGVLRQMMAVLTQPNRSRALHALRVPTTVVHGMADRMVHPSGGRATAQAIPGAQLLLIPGMGHDLPPELFDTFVEAIRRTADKVPARS